MVEITAATTSMGVVAVLVTIMACHISLQLVIRMCYVIVFFAFSATNPVCAVNFSSDGVLGPSSNNLLCRICYYPGHPVTQCPFRPSGNQAMPSTLALATMSNGDANEAMWFPDSGASAHMTPHDGNLLSKFPYNGPLDITVADGTQIPITNIDKSKIDTCPHLLLLHSVYHVSKLKKKLIVS